jgi:23S rRNA (guanosine2251-2'-O)-methyltransferase
MAESHGHQGVIAQVAAHEYIDLDEHIDKLIEDGKQPFVIILDSLKESYNLGSVLRIADAAGVDAVVIPERRSVALDATVAKASAGAVEYVPVARVNNLTNTVLKLKEKGFWIAGTDADATQMYWEADWKGPMAIVVGSEGEGISKGLLGHCDFLVSIPMSGEVNSLNAAVATGIIVFEAVKQRRS